MEYRGDERVGRVPSTWGDVRLRELCECSVRHGSARGDRERPCSSRRLAGCLGLRCFGRCLGSAGGSSRVPPVAVVTKDSSSLDTKLSTPENSPELGAATSRGITSRRIRDFIWQPRLTITKPNKYKNSTNLRRSNLGKPRSKVVGNRELFIKVANHLPTKRNWPIRSPEVSNALLYQWTEMTHQSLDWPCSSITQGTDSTTFNLFTTEEKHLSLVPGRRTENLRQFEQHVNLAVVAPALHHPVHHIHHPSRTFSARSTLTTGFMFVELRGMKKISFLPSVKIGE